MVEYLDTKNSSCKRCVFGKLVISLNTTAVASTVDKKVAYEKLIALLTLFHS